ASGDADHHGARTRLLHHEGAAAEVQPLDGALHALHPPPGHHQPIPRALANVHAICPRRAAPVVGNPYLHDIAAVERGGGVLVRAVDDARAVVVAHGAIPTAILAELEAPAPRVHGADLAGNPLASPRWYG